MSRLDAGSGSAPVTTSTTVDHGRVSIWGSVQGRSTPLLSSPTHHGPALRDLRDAPERFCLSLKIGRMPILSRPWATISGEAKRSEPWNLRVLAGRFTVQFSVWTASLGAPVIPTRLCVAEFASTVIFKAPPAAAHRTHAVAHWAVRPNHDTARGPGGPCSVAARPDGLPTNRAGHAAHVTISLSRTFPILSSWFCL